MRLAILALCGCSLAQVDHHRLERQVGRHDYVGERFTLGPHEVFAWHGGSGPAVVLLHGFGGDGLWGWRDQLSPWAATHEVVAPDLLWFGQSRSSAEPTLSTEADAVLALVDHLGIEHFSVVGASYGGFVALELARVVPERIDALVLVDNPAHTFGPADEAEMAQRLGVDDIRRVFVPQDADGARRLISVCFVHPPPLPGFFARDLLRHGFAAWPDQRAALLTDLHTHGSFGLDPASMPRSLVVWGDQDTVFPVRFAAPTAARLGAELRVIPDASHCPNHDQHAAFDAAVLGFLGG